MKKRSAEEVEPSQRKNKIREVPPLVEGIYGKINYPIKKFRDYLEQLKIHARWLIHLVDKMNKYAEIYCRYPTPKNETNVKQHLISYARACVYYKEQLRREYHGTEIEETKLDTIGHSCWKLVNCLFYVQHKDEPYFPIAPSALRGFPLAPVEGYKTEMSSKGIVDMFLEFTNKALGTKQLFSFVIRNKEAIQDAFEKIRSPNPNQVFEFNVNPITLRDELSSSVETFSSSHSRKPGDVMYIIHAFQIFSVYGNFIADETRQLVTGIHIDSLVNQSELASTVYLYLSMHGNIPIEPREMHQMDEMIAGVTRTMPAGMRIFIQKHSEPLMMTFSSHALQPFQKGTVFSHKGICDLGVCKQLDPHLCDCEDYLGDEDMISTLSTMVNEDLAANKVPSVASMQTVFNKCKHDSLAALIPHPSEQNPNPKAFIYEPGNLDVVDDLQDDGAPSRPREYIGRIPLDTTHYINKIFTADPALTMYGIYNLVNGDLITANEDFVDYIEQEGGEIHKLLKIIKEPSEERQEVPYSPSFVYQCTLRNIVDYFDGKHYRNIFLVDYSCEADYKSKTGFTNPQRILIGDSIGKKAVGRISKTSRSLRRHKKKRKTRKYNPKKSRRRRRKSFVQALTKKK